MASAFSPASAVPYQVVLAAVLPNTAYTWVFLDGKVYAADSVQLFRLTATVVVVPTMTSFVAYYLLVNFNVDIFCLLHCCLSLTL